MSMIAIRAAAEPRGPSTGRARWPRLALPRETGWVVAAWAAFVPLFALRIAFIQQGAGRRTDWGRAFAVSALDLAQWAAISLALLWFARRHPLVGGARAGAVAANAGAAILLALARTGADFVAVRRFGLGVPQENAVAEFGMAYVGTLLSAVTLLAAMHAVAYAAQLRQRERESLRLQARLAQAELSALKMQLHPHFLFNALNTIHSFVHTDPRAAGEMIGSLGDLLRASLAHGHAQEVALEEELAALEPYLEIERARFGPRLRVTVDAEPGTLRAQVPHLLLQPLVENAVRHGIAPRGGPGAVRVHAERQGACLRITVRDDGVGVREGWREGVGLSATRARLRHLYGDAQGLQVRAAAGGGTVAAIEIPFRQEAP
jgi:two-component system, LytTR family, sensor kinase